MSDFDENGQSIARLSIAAKLEYLPAIVKFTGEVSARLGLPETDSRRLELVTEEACVNVIEHAFDPGENGSYEVSVSRKPGQVVVTVEDRGLPFDIAGMGLDQESGLGIVLMKALADEVHFHNLGRRGKSVELVKNIAYESVDAYITDEEKRRAEVLQSIPADARIEYRRMVPEDAVNLARCVYRCYGYTYAHEKLYYPGKVRELLESRLLTSFIAIGPDGEIAGHDAISKDHPEAKIGEIGMAVVDPRYRGKGIQTTLGNMLKNDAREHGMFGIFAEVVTVHPYSQKSVIARGGKETGVLLGYIPATLFFKKFQTEDAQLRQSAILFYTRICDEPVRDVYPPFHHESIIRRIYEVNNFRRNIVGSTGTDMQTDLSPLSQLDVKADTDKGFGFLTVQEYGTDIVDLVKYRLRELCRRCIDCIYLDLPMSHPATRRFCAAFEMLGFFFGGILPEIAAGDMLRLQYLNNVEVDTASIRIASDFGKEMLDYICKAKGNQL